jgi:hypothetical protein
VTHLTLGDVAAIAAALAADEGSEVPLDWEAVAEVVSLAAKVDDPVQAAALIYQGLLPNRALAVFCAMQLLAVNGLDLRLRDVEQTMQELQALGKSIEQTEAWLTLRSTDRPSSALPMPGFDGGVTGHRSGDQRRDLDRHVARPADS